MGQFMAIFLTDTGLCRARGDTAHRTTDRVFCGTRGALGSLIPRAARADCPPCAEAVDRPASHLSPQHEPTVPAGAETPPWGSSWQIFLTDNQSPLSGWRRGEPDTRSRLLRHPQRRRQPASARRTGGLPSARRVPPRGGRCKQTRGRWCNRPSQRGERSASLPRCGYKPRMSSFVHVSSVSVEIDRRTAGDGSRCTRRAADGGWTEAAWGEGLPLRKMRIQIEDAVFRPRFLGSRGDRCADSDPSGNGRKTRRGRRRGSGTRYAE
jgi:hypothetical protein